MGQDSSDYAQCSVCEFYEICVVVYPMGRESGLFECENGHNFCIECWKKSEAFSEADFDEIFQKIEKQYADGVIEDYLTPKEFCPICQGSYVTDDQMLKHLIEKSGKTREEIEEEITKPIKNVRTLRAMNPGKDIPTGAELAERLKKNSKSS